MCGFRPVSKWDLIRQVLRSYCASRNGIDLTESQVTGTARPALRSVAAPQGADLGHSQKFRALGPGAKLFSRAKGDAIRHRQEGSTVVGQVTDHDPAHHRNQSTMLEKPGLWIANICKYSP
jgi:hypothetical protein